MRAGSYNYPCVQTNTKLVREIIEEEITKLGGDSKKLYIGGNSFGGSMALDVGLGYEKPLGAIVCLSGFKLEQTTTHENNKHVPILITHQREDQLLDYATARQTYYEDGWIAMHNAKFHEIPTEGKPVYTVDKQELVILKDYMEKLPK